MGRRVAARLREQPALLQLAALREQAGLSQAELARKLKTTQQQISRLESTDYEGHSLSMVRRVARVLNAHVRVVFEPGKKRQPTAWPSNRPDIEPHAELRKAHDSRLGKNRRKANA